jgi:hypothetical protein
VPAERGDQGRADDHGEDRGEHECDGGAGPDRPGVELRREADQGEVRPVQELESGDHREDEREIENDVAGHA